MSLELASRRRRFAAGIIDSVFNLLLLVTIGAFSTEDSRLIDRIELARLYGLEYRRDLIGLAWLAAFAAMTIHAVLIAWRGQSVAKVFFRLRIVLADGRVAGLYRGFILRYLPFALLSLLPSAMAALRGSPMLVSWMAAISILVHVVDVAMIAGNDRRCLHDRIAGTWVMEIPAVRSTRPSHEAPAFAERGKVAASTAKGVDD